MFQVATICAVARVLASVLPTSRPGSILGKTGRVFGGGRATPTRCHHGRGMQQSLVARQIPTAVKTRSALVNTTLCRVTSA
jgi:hypothetical protein